MFRWCRRIYLVSLARELLDENSGHLSSAREFLDANSGHPSLARELLDENNGHLSLARKLLNENSGRSSDMDLGALRLEMAPRASFWQ